MDVENVNVGAIIVALIAAAQAGIAGTFAWRRKSRNPLENGMDWVVERATMLAQASEAARLAAEAQLVELRVRINQLEANVERLVREADAERAYSDVLAGALRDAGVTVPPRP